MSELMPPPRVTFYTKAECELCEAAKAAMRAVQRQVPFEIVEVDITTDPDLYARYREEIPVAFLEGRKLFKYRCDPALLQRQLRRRRGWFSGS